MVLFCANAANDTENRNKAINMNLLSRCLMLTSILFD